LPLLLFGRLLLDEGGLLEDLQLADSLDLVVVVMRLALAGLVGFGVRRVY
jgi:hypothetical protein